MPLLGSGAKRYLRNVNWPLAAGGILVAAIGILCIRSAGLHSPDASGEYRKQILYLLLGVPLMWGVSLVDYRSWQRWAVGLYVVNLLLGRGDERMTRNGHDSLQVFGLLKESGEAAVRSWIDQLIVQDFLEVYEEREYPLLRITEAGKALCRDEGTVRLGVPAPPALRGKKKPKALRKSLASEAPPDEELFERLRQLRRLISVKLGVPPYVVFHDSALLEMAALKPKTLDALRGVKGVGDRKLERYGAAFLDVISGKPPESSARS